MFWFLISKLSFLVLCAKRLIERRKKRYVTVAFDLLSSVNRSPDDASLSLTLTSNPLPSNLALLHTERSFTFGSMRLINQAFLFFLLGESIKQHPLLPRATRGGAWRRGLELWKRTIALRNDSGTWQAKGLQPRAPLVVSQSPLAVSQSLNSQSAKVRNFVRVT